MTRIIGCGDCLDTGVVEIRGFTPGYDLCDCLTPLADRLREETAPSSPPAGCSGLLSESVSPARTNTSTNKPRS